jgi:hypothetical protein
VRVSQSEVPIEFRRKALHHLESIRDTPMGPGAETAELAEEVCPIYRPDIDGVAYWEFSLVSGESAPKVTATGAALADPSFASVLQTSRDELAGEPAAPTGFILVSTGEHDVPVPHWSLERPPVSRQLEQDAQDGGGAVARVYKVDALAYVGENEAGEEVARSGQTPGPLEGLGHDPSGHSGEISSLIARPARAGRDDEASAIKHRVSRRGPEPPTLQPSDPGTWPRLKERYGDAFGPFLDALRRHAEEPWKIDRAIAEFGEGIVAGEPFAIGLLRSEAAIEVTGEGAGLVDVELEEKPGRRPRIRAHARPSPHGRETDFEVRIRYANGEEETLRYFIVSRDTPSNVRAERELPPGGPE